MINQITNRRIKPFNISPVLCNVNTVCFRFIVLDKRLFWIMRRMWQHWCIPDEKRLLGVTTTINEVKNWLHGFSSDCQTFISVTRPLCHSFIETALRIMPLPPFSCLEASIAMLPKKFWECRPLAKSFGHLFPSCFKKFSTFRRTTGDTVGFRRIVSHDQMLMRIAARDE